MLHAESDRITTEVVDKKGSIFLGRTVGPPLYSGDQNPLPTKYWFFVGQEKEKTDPEKLPYSTN